MAYVINKGTRAEPNFHGRYQDAANVWKQIKIKLADLDHPTERCAQKWIDAYQDEIEAGKPDPRAAPTCGELFPRWLESLTNRNRKSEIYGANKHIVPAFKDVKPAAVEHTHIVRWLDKLKGGDKPLAGGSQRAYLNLLSRFFSWAVARGHAKFNPVRMVPRGERPKGAPKTQDAPWLKDDAKALAIAGALPSPLGLMYFIGYRCGLRPGEVAGLRLSDLGELDAGRLRCRHHEAGPLKEDKGDGPVAKVKWPPMPPDVQMLLGSWLTLREVQNAGAEDFLFQKPAPRRGKDRGHYTKNDWPRPWKALPDDIKPGMTPYQATRHSFTSRKLSEGVPLDEVSGALGHSTPMVTARYYAHFIRKDYSRGMLTPLKLTDAKVLPFKKTG